MANMLVFTIWARGIILTVTKLFCFASLTNQLVPGRRLTCSQAHSAPVVSIPNARASRHLLRSHTMFQRKSPSQGLFRKHMCAPCGTTLERFWWNMRNRKGADTVASPSVVSLSYSQYVDLTVRFPHRKSPDQSLFVSSPKLIADYHVLALLTLKHFGLTALRYANLAVDWFRHDPQYNLFTAFIEYHNDKFLKQKNRPKAVFHVGCAGERNRRQF